MLSVCQPRNPTPTPAKSATKCKQCAVLEGRTKDQTIMRSIVATHKLINWPRRGYENVLDIKVVPVDFQQKKISVGCRTEKAIFSRVKPVGPPCTVNHLISKFASRPRGAFYRQQGFVPELLPTSSLESEPTSW